MALRDDLLQHLWQNRINAYMQEDWIDKEIAMSQRHPNAPFADVGPVITRRELSLIARAAEYNGVFDAFYALDSRPGIGGEDLVGLHESLLMADPSGLEGRPGSAPPKKK
jgi:hypothetical protein